MNEFQSQRKADLADARSEAEAAFASVPENLRNTNVIQDACGRLREAMGWASFPESIRERIRALQSWIAYCQRFDAAERAAVRFKDWRREVEAGTCYDWTDDQLWKFYEDGDSVDDAIEWAEAQLDAGLFG